MITKSELEALSETLTRKERYGLDAYYENVNENGVKTVIFEMTLDEYPMWSANTWSARAKTFFNRNDVKAYLELKRISNDESQDVDIDNVEAKDYNTIILELEKKRAEADTNKDNENYLKYSKLLLDYMKTNKDDTGNDNHVVYYTPQVCIDDCPLYKRERDKIINEQLKKE